MSFSNGLNGMLNANKKVLNQNHHQRKDRDGKFTKSTGHAGHSKSSAGPKEIYSNISFLFVANEVEVVESSANADIMGNRLPPQQANEFLPEITGTVFRYAYGTVTVAESYHWSRNGPGQQGCIMGWTYTYDEEQNAMPVLQSCQEYSTRTVFHCGPFAPHVFAHGDASVASDERFMGWNALHFEHDHAISRALTNGGTKYVAGRHPSWMDGEHQIVSKLYKNPDPSAPRSVGLGGELALVIGLLALSTEPGHIDSAFRHRKWHQGLWTGVRHGTAWPATAHDPPRGVIVHVALEPEQGVGQTEYDLKEFEWYGIPAVKG